MTFKDGAVLVLVFVLIFVSSLFSMLWYCLPGKRPPYSLP